MDCTSHSAATTSPTGWIPSTRNNPLSERAFFCRSARACLMSGLLKLVIMGLSMRCLRTGCDSNLFLFAGNHSQFCNHACLHVTGCTTNHLIFAWLTGGKKGCVCGSAWRNLNLPVHIREILLGKFGSRCFSKLHDHE